MTVVGNVVSGLASDRSRRSCGLIMGSAPIGLMFSVILFLCCGSGKRDLLVFADIWRDGVSAVS